MANIPTTSWDETAPAGSQAISLGDDRIRELKTQIREVIDVDHDFPSSGQAADNGQHKKVTLQETDGSAYTGAVGATILYSKTVSGKGELHYRDEDDNDIQITSAGKIKAESIAGVYPAANVAAIASIMTLIYPVGSYYFNDSVSTNPGTLLGVGTWVAVEEVVLVGYKPGSDEFGTPGGSYGSKTVTLDITQIPPHTIGLPSGGVVGAGNFTATSPTGTTTNQSDTIGGGGAHNNCQLSRTVYMWRRTV